MSEILGKNLKYLRKTKGWNQEELARQLGIKRSSIAAYESKHVEPRLKVIFNMATLFGVDFDKLVEVPFEQIKKYSEDEQGGNLKESIQQLFSINTADKKTLHSFSEKVKQFRVIYESASLIHSYKLQKDMANSDIKERLELGEVDNVLFLINTLLETDEDLLSTLLRTE